MVSPFQLRVRVFLAALFLYFKPRRCIRRKNRSITCATQTRRETQADERQAYWRTSEKDKPMAKAVSGPS
jgi:hypothetical protein